MPEKRSAEEVLAELATPEEAVNCGISTGRELLKLYATHAPQFATYGIGSLCATLLDHMYAALSKTPSGPTGADKWMSTILEATSEALATVRGIDVKFTFVRRGD